MAKTVNYQREATRIAKKYKIPVPVFHALVGAESAWNKDAVSSAGALGFTQLMPGTAQGLGVDPRDPLQNLEGGARYLRQQLDAFGSLRLALAAYNAGPGAVRRYGGVPPFSETQRYVTKILQAVPTEMQAARKQPTKQQAVTTAPVPPVGPPPASLLGQPAPSGAGLEALAFENLGRIARGESPTYALSQFVNAVAALPAQDASVPEGNAPRPQPIAPKDTGPGDAPRPAAVKGGDDWEGSYAVAKMFAEVGFRQGLKSISEKRDRKMTKTKGVSDHWAGKKNAYAFDLSDGASPTPAMDASAVEIAKLLGVDYNGKDELVLTVNQDGFRIQVLYRTQVGGNHYNHLHIGVEKL